MTVDGNILIFADGASKGNPGPGGWGALVSYNGSVAEFGGRAEHTTNNRMELTAALEALQFLQKMNVRGDIAFHTDSSYVINGITKWVYGWKKNDWQTKEKKPVLNRDLWEALYESALLQKIRWEHVGGHVGVIGNERADAIASAFAEGVPVELFSGTRAAYEHEIENISHDKALLAQRSKSRAHSSAKAYSYVSAVDGVVMTHKTWDECKKRVEGKKARYKKALSAADEAKIKAEFASKR